MEGVKIYTDEEINEKQSMKAHLRIPTREQYAYIEIEVEGTVEEIISTYLKATDTYKTKSVEWEQNKPPF